MQVCISLQTENHASTPPLSFLQAGCPSCRPTNSVKALKAFVTTNWRNNVVFIFTQAGTAYVKVLLTWMVEVYNKARLANLICTDNDRLMEQVSNLKHGLIALRLALNTFLVAAPDAVFDQWRQTTQLRYCHRLQPHRPNDIEFKGKNSI